MILRITFFVLSFGLLYSAQAQRQNAPNALGLRFLVHDYMALDPLNTSGMDATRWGYGIDINYQRYLSPSFNLQVPLRLGGVTAYFPEVVYDAQGDVAGYLETEKIYENQFFAGLDVMAMYKFNNGYILEENAKVAPYLLLGVGGKYLSLREESIDLQIPVGVGAQFYVHPSFAIQVQAEYRQSISFEKNNLAFTVGGALVLGQKAPEEEAPKDMDGDGIVDKDDKCPEVAGLKIFSGCPDTDKDGIPDAEDACPNESGLIAFSGCPDTDKDGIPDKEDACPDEFGLRANNGCPASEEVKKEDLDILERAMTDVQFETGKATLKTASYTTLNEVAEVLLRYPNYNLQIHGHTDKVGSSSKNLILSKDRAKACYEHLIAQGIEASRLEHDGFGETRPRATNETKEGRALNRRVEFKLFKKD